MEHVEVSRRFEAAPEAVWRRYSDPISWKEWAGVGEASLEREGTEDPNGVGCIRVLGPPGFLHWRCEFRPVLPGTGWLLRAVVSRTFRRALTGLAKDLRTNLGDVPTNFEQRGHSSKKGCPRSSKQVGTSLKFPQVRVS